MDVKMAFVLTKCGKKSGKISRKCKKIVIFVTRIDSCVYMTEDALFYREFMSQMRKKVPHGATLANTVADLLDIEKDTTYRRLRGEVHFSFTEMAIIAKNLGISLDKIAGIENTQTRPARMNFSNQLNPTPVDYDMFHGHVDLLKAIRDEPDTQIIEAANIFPHYLYQDYEYLTRYYIFRWNHAVMRKDVLPYHEIVIPEKMRVLQKETCQFARHISSTTYVWDNMLVQRLVSNINYFAKANLIKKEDVTLIKNDLTMLMSDLERIAGKGKHDDTGREVLIFISDVVSDTNYSCLKTANIHLTLFRAFMLNAAVTFDVETFNYACAWIHALQRMSTLISVSGEKARALYFDTQREIINTL